MPSGFDEGSVADEGKLVYFEAMKIDYPLKIPRFTRSHIEYLIEAKAEESIHMEFKSGRALGLSDYQKKELSKDVSAMANSDGGIIIYGLNEEEHSAHDIDFVDGNEFPKEWLEQVINSKIKRRIPNLHIDVIRFNKEAVRTVYVVRIPKSYDAPHMASDGRYYKRYNFELLRMEEYEVREMFSRSASTQLKLLPLESKIAEHPKGNGVLLNLVIDVQNISNSIEDTYKTIIRIPREVYDDSPDSQSFKDYFRKYQPDYALLNIPATTPLFPKEINTLANFHLHIKATHWEVMDNFPLRIRFYYANGIYESDYFLKDLLKINGRSLTKADLMPA